MSKVEWKQLVIPQLFISLLSSFVFFLVNSKHIRFLFLTYSFPFPLPVFLFHQKEGKSMFLYTVWREIKYITYFIIYE